MLQKLLFKILRKSKAWFCRQMSTLKPEGEIGRNEAVIFHGGAYSHGEWQYVRMVSFAELF